MKTRLYAITHVLSMPPAVGAQTAEESVKKTIEARGGIEKIKAVQFQRIRGHVSFTQGTEGTFIVELKRPLKMHVEISVGGQKFVRVYDGKTGWMINPFAESKDVQPLPPEELKNISDESDFDGPLVDYKSKGNQIELVGKEKLDDKPVYRLKLTNKNGDVRSYFIDASSFLLLKCDGVRNTVDHEVPSESFFSDFRHVQ